MMCKCGVLLSVSVVILSTLILLVTSFNVDTFNYVQHKGPEQSMFGFSVATHKEHGRSWVIVGAPTSQGQQSRIHRGGVVFKCSTTSDNGCEEVDFHQERSGGNTPDDKNNQWFGATISSAGPDGPVVACAPRYVWFTTSREERRDPVGTCYIARDDFRKFSEYSPCRTSLFGYHRQGSCQAGFSAGISKDGKRLFVGAPGSWYWQGQMYSIDPMIKFPYTPGIFGEAFGFGTKGQVIQQSLDDRPAVMSTPEGPATDDDSYMGYSMVVGDFNGEGVQGVAVGMPKGGEMLEGKVLFYTWNLTNYLNITGQQLGAYFGYALATSDIDGDRRDDLIIGAPLHTEPNNEMKYEVGRVYVAYQGRNGSYAHRGFLDGINSKSRFGLSLSTLGDLNLDGYGDFAVGAPYDGPNERGAVYIFQGSANGVIKKYSQVIYAEDVQGSFGSYYPLSTFGFSIAGGLDLDENDYPDLAIGAYLSDTAYFFRARPVVKVEALVRFDEPKVIRLDRKTCEKPGDPGTRVACTGVQVCMKYNGKGAPARIDMDLQYILDAQKPKYSRIYLGRGSGKVVNTTITLYKDAPLNCDLRDMVYLQETIVDKLTDLEIELKYSLRDSLLHHQPFQRDPRSILVPIVDLSTPAVVNDSISIFKNCGPDNVCIPDLHLYVKKEVSKYLYEAGKPLEFDIEVTNTEDDSYNTKFYVQLPKGIVFKVAYIIDSTQSETKLSCSQTFNESIFVCDIGNPLQKNTGIHFKLKVEPLRQQKLLKPTYEFHMNVTSANPENNWTLGEDNSKTIFVDIWVDAVLAIEGKSTPTNVYYNISQYSTVKEAKWDSEVGPPVIHSYTVTNKGPSDVEEVEIFIIWPVSTLAGEDLLYLLEPPHTLGGVKCDPVETNYNEYSLALQRNVWEAISVYEVGNGTGEEGFITQTQPPIIAKPGNTITRTITVLTFYDINKKPVHQMEVIGEPGSQEYWKNVSVVASQFTGPLTVEGNSSSLVIEYYNGREISRKIVSRAPGSAEMPFMSYQINSNVTTLVSYYALPDNLVYQEYIVEQPGSATYNDRIKSTKERLRQPVKVRTNTTWHFDFVTSDGKSRYHYIISRTGTEFVTDSEITSTTVFTVVTCYDRNGKILLQDTVEGEPNSAVYWERINKIISGFDEPVTVHTNSTKVITHVINGEEVRKEEIPIQPAALEAALKTHTETITAIKIVSSTGKVLFQKDIGGDIGSTTYNKYLDNILRGVKEPVTIETKTVYTITYSSSDGRAIYTGIYTKIRTETYNPSQIESTRTTTVTTVTFYDVYRNIVYQENITDELGSAAYWERINGIISRYQQQQVTIHVNTRTIKTYYINGQRIRSEQVGEPIAASEYRPQTVITTKITVYSASGKVLYEETIPGKKDSVDDIISTFQEPITVEIKTVYTITYFGSDGRVTHKGSYIETRTEPHTLSPIETSRTSTITTLMFYDINGNIIYQEDITDEPESTAYWEKINRILSRYYQQQQRQVTIRVSTKIIITYYRNGQVIRTEQVGGPTGARQSSLTPRVVISTAVKVYDSKRKVVYEGTAPGEKESPEYNTYISNIISRFRGPLTIVTKTTYTFTYYSSDGRKLYTGSEFKEESQTYNPQREISKTHSITTITFYGPNRNILHQETITDEPRSPLYWEHIKNAISNFNVPVNIHTNSSKIITYYVDGIETRNEHVPGISLAPFTSHIDIVNVITYYDANRNELFRESVHGELSPEERSRRIADFTKRYSGSFTMETNVTKTITYRTSDGQLLHTDGIFVLKPGNPPNQLTRTVTETTFTVYGPDRRTILYQETIQGEPGSAGYNNALADIIRRFTGSITIYTNSTKTITFYSADGRELNTQSVPEPRSTVQRQGDTSQASARTTITFYAPDGRPIHHDTIEGAPGPDLYEQLNQIAREYGGVVKSYGGQLNEDGSIGGSVTVVDTPYPGNKPKSTGPHFSEFNTAHGQSHWNGGFNQSYQHSEGRQGSGYSYGADSSSQRFNLQDLSVNQQDLGSFAKGKNFRAGGIDLGITNSGSVDQSIDGKARSNFETLSETQLYDGSHNYLSGVQTYSYDIPNSRGHHDRRTRQVDTTDNDIKKLSNCSTSRCHAIRCVSGPIRKGDEVHIALRARVIVQTLKNISMTQPVNIQSMLLARISHFHEISGSPAQRTLYRHQVVTSVMAPQPDIKPDIVPLWVVILSAVAGTLILLLLIFLLHKCGFFKRNRPSDAPERQPLNRNGHFQHGDEAL